MIDEYGIWIVCFYDRNEDPILALEGTWQEAAERKIALEAQENTTLLLRKLPEIEVLSCEPKDPNPLVGTIVDWYDLITDLKKYEQMPLEYISDPGPTYQVLSSNRLPKGASSSSGIGYILKITDPVQYGISRAQNPHPYQWWGEHGWQDPL